MTQQDPSMGPADARQAVRAILKSQYHATLAMLRETIEKCPETLWYDAKPTNAFWQVAYHTLFFAHLYSQKDEAAFRPWEKHQEKNQYPDGIPGPADPKSDLPLLPDPYSKADLLEYWSRIDRMIDATIDSFDPLGPESGFSWYKVPKLEHQIVNLRHIQHGAAQLADRLRSATDIGIDWVGAQGRVPPRAAE